MNKRKEKLETLITKVKNHEKIIQEHKMCSVINRDRYQVDGAISRVKPSKLGRSITQLTTHRPDDVLVETRSNVIDFIGN